MAKIRHIRIDDDINLIFELLISGISIEDIAEKFDLNLRTVRKYQEILRPTKQEMIKIMGDNLNKIRELQKSNGGMHKGIMIWPKTEC